MEEIDKIHKYLEGEMTPAEVQSFEREMSENDALADAVNMERNLIEGIFAAGLRKELESLSKAEIATIKKEEVRVVSMARYTKWAAAASVALLLGFFLWTQPFGSEEDLFAGHFEADAGLPVVMGADEGTAFNDAMSYYKNDEFDVAIKGFEGLCTSANQTACFYLASSYIQLNEMKTAKEILDNISSDGLSIDLQQKIDWTRAFVYYKIGDDQFQSILSKISSDPSHLFYQKAKEISE